MQKYCNLYLACKQQQLYGPVKYRGFRETGLWYVAHVTAAMSVVKYKNVSLDRWELKSFFIIDARRKRHFKRELGFFQSSSRLLNSLTLSNVGEFSGS